MTRTALQTVTSFPVIFPCKADEDGLVDEGGMPTPVRVLTTQAIIDAVSKQPRSKDGPLGISASDWSVLNALKLLHRARELNDFTAAKAGSEILARSPQMFQQDKSDPALAGELARVLALDATGHSNQAWGFLCSTTNRILKGAHIIMWRPGKRAGAHDFKPEGPPRRGVYCRDVETAVAYKLLFNGTRICLRCHDLFSGKSNMDYCSMQCRETHRVARWRERQKVKLEQLTKGKRGRR